VAVGSGSTVTVALLFCNFEQALILASSTLIKLYVKIPSIVVFALTVATSVVPVDVTVVFAPPLML